MAAALEVHPRTLRIRMWSRPETVPPFVQVDSGPHNFHYEFPQAGFDLWLQARDVLRSRTKKPHLRWLEERSEAEEAFGDVVAAGQKGRGQ
jgi:hypothetical protein